MDNTQPVDLNDYTKLAHHLAYRMDGLAKALNVDHEDLYQIAMIGLWRASTTFDSNFGVKFITYAMPFANADIQRHLRALSAQKRTAIITSLDSVATDSGTSWHNFNRDERAEFDFKCVDVKVSLQQTIDRNYFLSATEKKIVKYLLKNGVTARKEIGDYVGVSRTQVNRMMVRLRGKLSDCIN